MHRSTAEAEANFETLKKYKLSGIDPILAEAIQTGDKPLYSHIHKRI
jgi:hypothetical protein